MCVTSRNIYPLFKFVNLQSVMITLKTSEMTTIEIQEQITLIKQVAKEATISKEFALQFLNEAGILELIRPTESLEIINQ